MDFLSIVSAVAAVVGAVAGVIGAVVAVIALFFDIPKIKVSVEGRQKFLRIAGRFGAAAVVCLCIFCATFFIQKYTAKDTQSDSVITYQEEDSEGKDTDAERESADDLTEHFEGEDMDTDSESVETDSGEEENSEEEDSENGSEASFVSDGNEDVLQIEPITEHACVVGAIVDMFGQVAPVVMGEVHGEIVTTDQRDDYEFFPQVSGVHRFEFSNVPNGTDLRLRIYNSGWEELKTDYDLDNEDGLTYSLTAGETYYISVEQYRGVGSYTLNMWSKKEIVDITTYTAVADSIQYTDQENDYLFVPENDGTYRFEFSYVPNGTDLRLRIYNSGWEELTADYDLDNGDGLTYQFTAGETYYIRVGQYRYVGDYRLNIGRKKAIQDITAYTEVSDSIQYTAQENDYLFVAGYDGAYRFEFSGVPNGTDLRLRIYNSGWEELAADYDLDNEDGITYECTAGETYYISVGQYRDIGDYTLNIGWKKAVRDITDYGEVSDSIQYTAQENDYLFVAEEEGTYWFELSGISEGNTFRMEVFNSGWELLQSNYALGNEEGLEVQLSGGESYFIRVAQYNGGGDYRLMIERWNL